MKIVNILVSGNVSKKKINRVVRCHKENNLLFIVRGFEGYVWNSLCFLCFFLLYLCGYLCSHQSAESLTRLTLHSRCRQALHCTPLYSHSELYNSCCSYCYNKEVWLSCFLNFNHFVRASLSCRPFPTFQTTCGFF